MIKDNQGPEASKIIWRTPDTWGISLAELFRPDGWPYLCMRIGNGQYVTRAQIRAAKAANPGLVVPEAIVEYESRLRRREVKLPGRPRLDCRRVVITAYARMLYPVLLRRIRRHRFSAHGERAHVTTGGRMPPHERAARLIARKYFPSCDWRHVINLIHEH